MSNFLFAARLDRNQLAATASSLLFEIFFIQIMCFPPECLVLKALKVFLAFEDWAFISCIQMNSWGTSIGRDLFILRSFLVSIKFYCSNNVMTFLFFGHFSGHLPLEEKNNIGLEEDCPWSGLVVCGKPANAPPF
jgi:hypothetical protein